jgi:aminopeptidase-like protein
VDGRAPSLAVGEEMHGWARSLFPHCRSITGPGVRQTLAFLKELLPDLQIHEVPSGAKAFDWTVPDEWSIEDAFVADSAGNRVIDFRKNNLHVVGYSEPVDCRMTREELDKRLFSLPEQPKAIPYRTSYYAQTWGFCLSHEQRQKLPDGDYHVVIKSRLAPGVLNYGELLLEGREKSEVLLSTYICHPSMANNELSGPVVTAALARRLAAMADRRHSYRIVFGPETIGAIVYLSRNLAEMKRRVIAGFNITCVGDDRRYSFLPSRQGDTLADRAARYVLDRYVGDYDRYSFLDRGSDERQYCSPLVDLPVVSLMRSKYGTYDEYHTSLDDLSLISPAGLAGAYDAIGRCLDLIEANATYVVANPCEPQLGKRGLYPSMSTPETRAQVRDLANFLAYADGKRDLLDLADTIGADFFACAEIAATLRKHDLIVETSPS